MLLPKHQCNIAQHGHSRTEDHGRTRPDPVSEEASGDEAGEQTKRVDAVGAVDQQLRHLLFFTQHHEQAKWFAAQPAVMRKATTEAKTIFGDEVLVLMRVLPAMPAGALP